MLGLEGMDDFSLVLENVSLREAKDLFRGRALGCAFFSKRMGEPLGL